MPRFDEQAAVALLERLFSGVGSAQVELGIGDDAALLNGLSGRLAWTVDTAVESVHFRRDWLTLQQVGFRSFMAAASDLAAMGATPVAALSSVIAPRGFGRRGLGALARGQAEAARELACPLVGGNLSRGGELSVTTSVIGRVKGRPLLRSGAVPGDQIWLSGPVGLARAGLLLLERNGSLRSTAARRCVHAWRRPVARIAAGRQLLGRASAAIDVSDGLAGDAEHIAEASGVRLVINEELLISLLPAQLFEVAKQLETSALALALSGGEDYALLACGPGSRRPSMALAIGEVERGSGVKLETPAGTRRAPGRGFDHFSG